MKHYTIVTHPLIMLDGGRLFLFLIYNFIEYIDNGHVSEIQWNITAIPIRTPVKRCFPLQWVEGEAGVAYQTVWLKEKNKKRQMITMTVLTSLFLIIILIKIAIIFTKGKMPIGKSESSPMKQLNYERPDSNVWWPYMSMFFFLSPLKTFFF